MLSAQSVDAGAAGRIARILGVEDEPVSREVVAGFLEDPGFDVTATCTGDEAALLLTEAEFAVLLTDITMPGEIDGIGLAEHAREIHPGLPIVFVSGRAEAEPRARAVTEPTAYFRKPFDIDALVVTVGRMVRATA